MPAKTKKPPTTIDGVRRQLADAEALVAGLRAKLAKMEAHEKGQPEPACGLDLLWDAALPISRQRSSKHKCRVAWARLPAAARPTIAVAVAALKEWNRCKQWYIDDHMYAKGLDKWIKDRMWEDLPAESKTAPPLHRNMSPTPKPPTAQVDDEHAVVLSDEEMARLLGLRAKPAPLPKVKQHVHGPTEISDMLKFIDCDPNAEASRAKTNPETPE